MELEIEMQVETSKPMQGQTCEDAEQPAQPIGQRRPLARDALSMEAQRRLDELIAEFDPLATMLTRARQRRGREIEAAGLASRGGVGDLACGSNLGRDGDPACGGPVNSAAGHDTSHVAMRRGAASITVTGQKKRRSLTRDIRLPPPGEYLRRDYRGRDILVRILDRGFEFEGRRYRSLSAIAKAVTGAHWNGLLFFGLVKQDKSASTEGQRARQSAEVR